MSGRMVAAADQHLSCFGSYEELVKLPVQGQQQQARVLSTLDDACWHHREALQHLLEDHLLYCIG